MRSVSSSTDSRRQILPDLVGDLLPRLVVILDGHASLLHVSLANQVPRHCEEPCDWLIQSCFPSGLLRRLACFVKDKSWKSCPRK